MQNAARELSRTVKITNQTKSNLSGSETAYGQMISQVPKLPALTYTLDNTTSASKNYIIGDPHGMIAAALGGTISNPTKLQGNTALVSPNKAMFINSSVLFSEITWKTSSSAAQFDNTPVFYTCNLAGNYVPDTVNLAVAEKNTAQNTLILTTKGQFRLDAQRGLFVTVDAGEKLSITMSPSAYTV